MTDDDFPEQTRLPNRREPVRLDARDMKDSFEHGRVSYLIKSLWPGNPQGAQAAAKLVQQASGQAELSFAGFNDAGLSGSWKFFSIKPFPPLHADPLFLLPSLLTHPAKNRVFKEWKKRAQEVPDEFGVVIVAQRKGIPSGLVLFDGGVVDPMDGNLEELSVLRINWAGHLLTMTTFANFIRYWI